MSDVLETAAARLREKLGDGSFDGSVRFDIEGEGAIRLDESGVAVDDGDADVTISAALDVFEEMFNGELNPTAAFMSGRIRIDGDMGVAMKLAQVFG